MRVGVAQGLGPPVPCNPFSEGDNEHWIGSAGASAKHGLDKGVRDKCLVARKEQ